MFPWHQPVVEQIAKLLAAGRLPNALALTGPEGWGMPTLVQAVALDLLETTTRQSIEDFAHPDLRWIVPEGTVIKIDQIRKLVEFAVQTAQLAPRKVAVVLDAHLLNLNAANALLKTLEEPPPNTHLILATAYWGKLLPTIRSRAQRFTVPADRALAESWLQQQGLEPSPQAWALAGFAPLKLAIGAQEGAFDVAAWLGTVSRKSLPDVVEELLDADTPEVLARWYRLLRLSLHESPIPQVNMPPARVHQFSDQILDVRRQLASSNAANARLLCESLVVSWRRLSESSQKT